MALWVTGFVVEENEEDVTRGCSCRVGSRGYIVSFGLLVEEWRGDGGYYWLGRRDQG